MAHGRMGWLEGDLTKFYSGAAARNAEGISAVLRRHLAGAPPGALVLEVGSGSGQHVAHFAHLLPHLAFQPTEFPGHPNPLAEPQDEGRILRSIDAYTRGLGNVRPAAPLDASALAASSLCEDGEAVCIVAINVAHISPPAVLGGLVAGAARKLRPGGCLVLYGPWAVDGAVAGEGNVRFDAMLRRKDPRFGLRDTAVLKALGVIFGLELSETVFFEASNNHALVLVKKRAAGESARSSIAA